jgi:hypothetical protein
VLSRRCCCVIGDSTELLRRSYCDPTSLLSECRVTAFVLSMLKMRAVGLRSMQCCGDAAAMFAILLRSPRRSKFSLDAVRTPP